MITIETVEALLAAQGAEMGVSDWHEVTQELVNAFAEVTGDRQFIHVDPVRAVEAGLGGTIAHGYLTLSLLPMLARTRAGIAIAIPVKMAINYGLDKVRFIAPVRIPSRIRLSSRLGSVDRVSDGILQVKLAHTVEIEGAARPAMYAETVTRYQL
ncbi:MAG: MaoC family dehydratase [Hyphomicrobiaceae bacterium]|nr:MaoC family dehydratase [Hyphomicrobiaceae bacterium]